MFCEYNLHVPGLISSDKLLTIVPPICYVIQATAASETHAFTCLENTHIEAQYEAAQDKTFSSYTTLNTMIGAVLCTTYFIAPILKMQFKKKTWCNPTYFRQISVKF